MILVHFQGKLITIKVIQVYAPTTNAEGAEVERFYEHSEDLLELTPKKRCPFRHRRLECKSRKSRDSWSNRQIWLWSIKWSTAKARVLTREHTSCSQHPLPTTQEMTLHMDTHACHQMANTKVRLFIFVAAKDGETLYSEQKQDWELTVG